MRWPSEFGAILLAGAVWHGVAQRVLWMWPSISLVGALNLWGVAESYGA